MLLGLLLVRNNREHMHELPTEISYIVIHGLSCYKKKIPYHNWVE